MRKNIAFLLALLLCLCSFAGCAGNSSSPAPASSAAESSAAPAPAEPAPAAPADEKIEISLQYIGGTAPAGDAVIDEAIAAFNEKNPNITVKPIYIDWGNGHSKFMNSVMAGQAPDIAMLGGTWCVEFIQNGAIADISPYVSAELIDSFIPSAFEVMTDANGVRYGLPWEGGIWSIFYRTDLFEEAGIDKVPQTWDELLAVGEKFKSMGKYTISMPCQGWEPDDYFLPVLYQAGANVCEFEDGKWVSKFNTPEALNAAKFYYDLTNTYGYMPKEITGMDWESTKNFFVAGDTAMMVNGMWVIGTIKAETSMDGKWATAGPLTGKTTACLSSPSTVHITSQSKYKEVAGQFLEFFYGEDYYDLYCEKINAYGVTKDFIDREYAKDPLLAPFIQSTEFGKNRPVAPKYEQFRQLFFNAGIQSLASGNITPEQFCAEMDTAFTNLH